MSMRVLLPQAIAPEGEAFLIARGYALRHGQGIDQETLIADIRDCDAALVRTAIIDDAVLAAGHCLKVVAKHGAGVDNIDVEAATRRGIRVVNAPLGMTNAVAEYTVMMMLALSRQMIPCDRAFRQTGDFSLRSVFHMAELTGKVVGIVGLGRIGSAVARRLAPFEMKLLGYDPYLADAHWPDSVERAASIDGLIAQSDYLTLHLPLNNDTHGILSAARIAMMKPTAFFVNAGRGELTNEKALIAALSDGRLAGAGIDVFAQEPPPKDHPFFSMDNVIVSPHNSALTPQAAISMAVDAAIGIDQVLAGQSVTWPVNEV